jgi:hypothetical protein
MKKGLIIGCIVVPIAGLACLGGIVYFVFALTRGAVEGADRFLSLLGQGKTGEAYAATADGFRNQQSEEQFTEAVRKLGLNDFGSSFWTTRNIVNDKATLEGTVSLKSGGSIPLTLQLFKEKGEWKVLELSGPKGGASVKDDEQAIPSDKELRRVTTQSLLDLNEAIKAKSFARFYDKIATLWKQQTTADDLQKAFQALIDAKADIAGIKDVAPIFDKPPAINKEKRLVLSGYYPTQPLRVVFNVQYLYEHPAWKLVGINVQLVATKPPAAKPDLQKAIPVDAELKKLVTKTLLDFDQAVKANNFKPFYNSLSRLWKDQTNPEALQKIFQQFIDKKIDISGIKDVSPVLEPKPAINEGLLLVQGHYILKSDRVEFTLRYTLESSAWKLAGISVRVK